MGVFFCFVLCFPLWWSHWHIGPELCVCRLGVCPHRSEHGSVGLSWEHEHVCACMSRACESVCSCLPASHGRVHRAVPWGRTLRKTSCFWVLHGAGILQSCVC